MVHYITYSNAIYCETRDFSITMALKKGKVDTVTAYKPEDIDNDFWRKNKEILQQGAGNGLWLWKPYFLNKKLKEVCDGDIVIYCDAGSFFFRSCKDIIMSMDDDIWVSDIPLIEKQFTKPELLEMMGCHDDEYINTNQVQANFIAIRKSRRGELFAKEWLDWCCKENALTRETIYLVEPPEWCFMGHRSDQSVLSLLVKKWGLKVHQDPTQYGRVPEKYYVKGRIYKRTLNSGEYNPCIILHREKKPSLKNCINQWLCTWLPLFIIHFISRPCRAIEHVGKGKLESERI